MAIALVNTSASFTAASAGTVASAATSLTAGNLIVVSVRFSTGGQTVSTVTDTALNTYTRIDTLDANTTTLELWYAQNVSGDASNVVTVTFSGSVSNRGLLTAQYSGVATTNALRFGNWATSSASANNITAPFEHTLDDWLLIMNGQINSTSGTWSAGTNLAVAVQDASGVQVIAEGLPTSMTTITPRVNHSITTSLQAMVAVFAPPDPVGGSGGEKAATFVGLIGS